MKEWLFRNYEWFVPLMGIIVLPLATAFGAVSLGIYFQV